MPKWNWKKPKTNYGYNCEKKTYGLFQTEMAGTTSVFGRDRGLEITFEGEKAFAKDNQINFPNLDMSIEIDDDTVTLCRGFVDHHAAKLRYSDRNVLAEMRNANEKSNPLLWHLFDSVESIRTESSYTKEYPGAKKNLSEMADEQAKKFKSKNVIGYFEKLPLSKVAPIAIASRGRKNMSYFGFGLNDVLSTLSHEDKDMVEEWAEDAAECKTSEDSVKLATKIFEYIQENPPPKSEDNNEDGEGEGDGNGGDDSEQPQQPFDYMPNTEDLVDSGLKWDTPKYDPSEENAPYKTFTKKYDRVHHWSDKHPGSDAMNKAYDPRHYYAGQWMRKNGDINAYMKKSQELGPTINVARRKLELMIAAQRRIEWDYLKERGKFDSKRMVAALTADPCVFKIKENAADIDTAISVVIDLSGSMNSNGKRPVATDTAIVLFECLTKIGIPLEIIGFDCAVAYPNAALRGEKGCPNRAYHFENRHIKCARYAGLHTYVFKSFKDKPFDARPYIMALNSTEVGSNNNSDGESILIAHERLEKRPEKRKIMFVLSDGAPATECFSYKQQYDYLRKAVDHMEKKGTHVIAIGITTQEVARFYPKYVVCHDAKDLTGTALNLLSDLLIPKKNKVHA